MKKVGIRVAVTVLLLCVGYLATPIRPAIARITANQFIRNEYAEYDCAPAEIVSIGYREYNWLTWITSYGAQSMNREYTVYIELNGWFPFFVQESRLWST